MTAACIATDQDFLTLPSSPHRRNLLVTCLKLFDVALMLACLSLSTFLLSREIGHLSLQQFLGMRVKVQNALLVLAGVWFWSASLNFFSAYDSRRLSTSGVAEAADVVKATTLSSALLLLGGWFIRVEIITVGSILLFWVLVTGGTIASRAVVRGVLRRLRRRGQNLNHLLIVGTNPRAVGIARRVMADAEFGYCLAGFVDEPWHHSPDLSGTGGGVVTDFSGFADYLRDHVVDEVLICVPLKSFYERSERLMQQCEEQGIVVRFVSDAFTPTRGRSHMDRFEEYMVVTVDSGSGRSGAVLAKHALDLILSAGLLLVLFPLLALIALAIRIDSPGPVFFIQERMGLNKRRFPLFKFRTMIPDAERRLEELTQYNEVDGPVFKMRYDPRITRIGRFLRKTSLDELPQLLNVVRAEMSLVGPRPLPVRDYEGFSKDWHRRRFSVRPGITCLWQICGRNSIPFERWMELDMQYIDQWSLKLDLEILLRTIPAVLRGSGAS